MVQTSSIISKFWGGLGVILGFSTEVFLFLFLTLSLLYLLKWAGNTFSEKYNNFTK